MLTTESGIVFCFQDAESWRRSCNGECHIFGISVRLQEATTRTTRDFIMSSTIAEMDETTSHEISRKKRNRRDELRHARKMIDTIQERQAAGRIEDDLHDFTAILSTVVDVLTSLEMQGSDDSGTAATLPETVATCSDNGECHGHVRRLDDNYEDEEQTIYEEPRKVHKHKRKHKKKEKRQESFSDFFVIEEEDDFEALSGYEEGFCPPEDIDVDTSMNDASINDSFARPTVSISDFGTPTSRTTKGTASVSEESQCFYCQMHGNEGGCQGTRFCC